MKRCYIAGILLVTLALPVSAAGIWKTLFSENLANARDGDADAQYEVGIMYLKGQGINADRDKAIEWLKAAAENDNDQAASKLLRMQDNVQAFLEIQKKARQGNAVAQYETGRMLLSGKGVEIDAQQAADWLEKAANQGHKKAAMRLGIIYYKGDAVPPDPQQAVELFTRAAASEVLAQYYLGEAYANGRGVERDYAAAINWYRKADNNGYKRAGGKIINVEEELKIQQRREARLAKETEMAEQAHKQAERDKRKQAMRAAEMQLAKIRSVKANAKPKRRQVQKTVATTPEKRDIHYLARKNWDSKGKSISFLPSELNQCEQVTGKLVCYSHKIQETSVGRTIKYRVKSIITPGKEADGFHVMYRNLVLDVVLHDRDDGADSYGDEQAQGFKVKTGWSKKHEVECKFASDSRISCLKDGVHRVKIAIANGGRDRDSTLANSSR